MSMVVNQLCVSLWFFFMIVTDTITRGDAKYELHELYKSKKDDAVLTAIMQNYKHLLSNCELTSLVQLLDTSLDKLFSKATTLIKDIVYHRWGDIIVHSDIIQMVTFFFEERHSAIKGREADILDTLILCLTSFLRSTICHKDIDNFEQIIKNISHLSKVVTKTSNQLYKTRIKRLTIIRDTLTGEHSASNKLSKIVRCILEQKESSYVKKILLSTMNETHLFMLAMTASKEVNYFPKQL